MYFKLKKNKISDTYKKKSLNYSSYYIQCFCDIMIMQQSLQVAAKSASFA